MTHLGTWPSRGADYTFLCRMSPTSCKAPRPPRGTTTATLPSEGVLLVSAGVNRDTWPRTWVAEDPGGDRLAVPFPHQGGPGDTSGVSPARDRWNRPASGGRAGFAGLSPLGSHGKEGLWRGQEPLGQGLLAQPAVSALRGSGHWEQAGNWGCDSGHHDAPSSVHLHHEHTLRLTLGVQHHPPVTGLRTQPHSCLLSPANPGNRKAPLIRKAQASGCGGHVQAPPGLRLPGKPTC